MANIDLTTVGFLAVTVGIVLIFLGVATQSKTKIEGGGVVFIGPIPIIGATSERSLYFVTIITVVFLLIFAILNVWGK